MRKVLLILVMLASTNALAAISKWVDDQGQVHYSDQPPPPGAQVETLHSGTDNEAGPDATSASAAPKTIAEQEADLKKAQREKKAAAEKAAQKQAVENARKDSCNTAQENLRTLQSGMRMVEINANGERSYLDDNQRQQRVDKAQQDISTYCK